MIRWQDFYDSYPQEFGSTEYLRQVGHTVNGQPISDDQFELILQSMQDHLDLQEDDVVLDLCCGNGLFTKELARRCERVVGVDFSTPLLQVARRDHCPENVTYHLMNALEVGSESPIGSIRFDKVIMCAALQHFDRGQLESLLEKLTGITSDRRIMVFLLVPDRRKKWVFYDTMGKRSRHLVRRILGRERMGTWWHPDDVKKICRRLGLQGAFPEMDGRLHAARYRFDIRLW